MNLTVKDINTLIAAMSSWEKEPEREALQTSMMGVVFARVGPLNRKDADDAVAEAKRKGDESMAKAEVEARARREVSVLLQAKLIMMRNEIKE